MDTRTDMASVTGEDDDQDVYVAQLREVFDSCDGSKQGFLNAIELKQLCNKLQLEEQSPDLIDQLIGDDREANVGFEEFKEAFVSVLSETVDGFDSSDGEDDAERMGNKKSASDERKKKIDGDFIEHSHETRGDSKSNTTTEQMESLGNPTHKDPVTFEAEGQMNQSISDMENMLDPISEEEHLKAIWKELSVGSNGYLTMNELAIVCEHIGMDEMNPEELQHLFDKLDVDGDGQVSFDEFLYGLFQHGGPNTPCTSTTPIRPLSTPRKIRMSHPKDMEDRIQTPSFFTSGLGLFSAFDSDKSGYEQASSIISLWETLGVPQGVEILQYLEFDLNSKVNLAELSHALEQELRSVEEDNATYQAALVTYEHEIKHVKGICEHNLGAYDKVKADLMEANHRITLLIKEGDDRFAASELTHEKELQNLEKKYQEQAKNTQTETDVEREALITQFSKQRLHYENEIKGIKEEESKLKDKFSQSQRDLKKMEMELVEIGDKYDEMERLNLRQTKEINSAADLHRKLEEMETNRESILDEHAKFSEHKLHQLESEKMELKDKNDELTSEVEELKQQMSSIRRNKKGHNGKSNADPKRTGSVLSDYAKPHMVQQLQNDSLSEGNSTDDDTNLNPMRRRRRLPEHPVDGNGYPRNDIETPDIKESIQDDERFHAELKKSEDIFRKQIIELEESHISEKNSLEQFFTIKIDGLHAKHEQDIKATQLEIEKEFAIEKQSIHQKYELEKDSEHQRFTRENKELLERLQKEFKQELNQKLANQKTEFTLQLEETVTLDKGNESDNCKQKDERELQIDNLRKENERILEDKRETQYEIQKYKEEILAYKDAHLTDVDGLQGQLRLDFYNLLEKHQLELEEKDESKIKSRLLLEKGNLEKEHTRQIHQIKREHEKERRELIKDYEKEKTTISQSLTKEKLDLEKKYQSKIDDLEAKLIQERDVLLKERDELHLSLNQERRLLELERQTARENFAEESTHHIQVRMEDEFLGQIDQLKEAFSDERLELESRIELLQNEIENLTSTPSVNDYDVQASRKELVLKQMEQLEKEKNELLHENDKLRKDYEQMKLNGSLGDGRTTGISKLNDDVNNGRLALLDEECANLRYQLDLCNKKLTETQAKLLLSSSEHTREIQAFQAKYKYMVDVDQHNELVHKLADTEQKVTNLERAMENRSTDTTKLLMSEQEKHSRDEQSLNKNISKLKHTLSTTTDLLQEQVSKYKIQLQRSSRNDLLIKDLYVENSKLMKCLEVTERRSKDAENKVYNLEDKCRALSRLMRKVAGLDIKDCPTARGK